jgi:hypothetical protein
MIFSLINKFLSHLPKALSLTKMKFQTTAKAVELKELIDNADRYLPDIGRCLSLELRYKRKHIDPEVDVEDVYDDDDDDNNDDRTEKGKQETKKEKQETLEKIQDNLVKIYDIEGFRMVDSGFECGSINVLGEEIQSLRDI